MRPSFLIVGPNGHISPLPDSGRVQAGLVHLLSSCTSRVDDLGRTRWDTHAKSLRMLERHFEAAGQDLRADAAALRGDAFDPGLGMFNPRDLTHRFQQVLEEKLPPLSGTKVFQINTEVQPGAIAYEQYRMYSTGEAVVYRGGSGSQVPEVGLGQATFRAPVVYLVAKATVDWLENMRSTMVGIDTQARKMRAARRVIEELENKWTFQGSADYDIYGLLNHPYMDTALSAVAYTAATAADDIVEDFGTWANWASNQSGSTFQPDTLLIAPKLYAVMANRRYGDNADKSIMQWMIDNNPHIKNVELVRELNDAGGATIHAFAFHRRGSGPADASLEIVKPLTTTVLPPERRSLATEMFLISGFGGLNQREAGDNLVVYVQGV